MNAKSATAAAGTNSAPRAASFDVAKIRADFPVLDQQVHGKPLVYLDNAASAQKPRCVIDAISYYYLHDHANVHRGVHTLSQRATDAYEGARRRISEYINAAHERECIYVRGATEGINLVAQSYARERLAPGDEILTTLMEHHSNFVPWQLVCKQTGAKLRTVAINDKGELDMESFTKQLSERTRIVACNHISNTVGTINPLKTMIAEAHAAGAVVIVDGAQALPHLRVDMRDLDCDFYAFSGHKMYGPTGIGILYGKEALLDAMPPYQGGGEMIKKVTVNDVVYNDLPHKFEAGTPFIAGAVGLGATVDYLQGINMEAVAAHEQQLLAMAVEYAAEVPGLRIIGNAEHKAGIFSFLLDNVHPHDVGTILDHEGVAVRTGHNCTQPLMDHYGIGSVVRASFGMYNTPQEVDVLFQGIARARQMFN